jgi:hypothetical protein
MMITPWVRYRRGVGLDITCPQENMDANARRVDSEGDGTGVAVAVGCLFPAPGLAIESLL